MFLNDLTASIPVVVRLCCARKLVEWLNWPGPANGERQIQLVRIKYQLTGLEWLF